MSAQPQIRIRAGSALRAEAEGACTVTFVRVIDELSKVAAGAPGAHEALTRVLTFDERLPIDHGAMQLADFDRHLYERLSALPQVSMHAEPPSGDGELIEAYWSTLARLHLRPVGDPRPVSELVTFSTLGWMRVPAEVVASARAAASRDALEERRLRERLDALLTRAESNGTLGEIVDAVADAVRHVEAVSFYIDDELYAAMERFQTLVERKGVPGIFERLRKLPSPASWTPAERLLVIALRVLFLSGNSIRFEEFNGANLTARRLVARISSLRDGYVRHGIAADGDTNDLFALAEAVGRAARSTPERGVLRYRSVSGWTFRKTEHVRKLAVLPRHTAFCERLALFAERWSGTAFDGSDAAAERVAEAVVAATEANVTTPGEVSPVEGWIQEIVAGAVEMTASDYGMSSSLRNVAPLALASSDEELMQIVNSLTTKDFYCCVTSRPGLAETIGPAIEHDVYQAVAMRMQFNRWHFIPGNFPRASIPANRHWFYPPVSPDHAEWSDVWHGGHIKAGVRYSIRAPGPDMTLLPLVIGRQTYRGFYDVRTVRMAGTPFNLDDLLAVRHHCLWMGALWRRLATSRVVITAFQPGAGYEPKAASVRRSERMPPAEAGKPVVVAIGRNPFGT